MVGTTQFDALIETILSEEIVQLFHKFKCKKIILQIGQGKIDDQAIERLSKEFDVEVYALKPTILPDVKSADLVISHAGAGSCIEVLNAGKPLVVVVNENLMDNHQLELAQKLSSDGYLFYCVPQTLATTLDEMNIETLKPYPKGNAKGFVKYLDEWMGFA
ncbi:UDP-N-acetylglucosamine transferase subunit ALG13 like [Pseudolycoriella hygida]|uniref:UDP-N-acetylglucosamine transferase subunit ALG13 n=1 Tax=Pseudolycoriella hygida TaxID=35572 RepID=A0A9Q0MVG0_9DIPT|nr:UDP-N-acetylglucosamine transferase subunit ALG13 like [Pseudolycoriella hygida]